MILDYKDKDKINSLIGQKVLITKFSTSLSDQDHKKGYPCNVIGTIARGSYIYIVLIGPNRFPNCHTYTDINLAWIEYELDPDENY